MLFIITIIVAVLVAVAAAFFVKRRIDRDLIESSEPKNLMDTNLRPLFPADEEEVRVSEPVDADVIDAEPVNDEHEKKLAKLEELRQTWRAKPTKRDTLELITLAAEIGSASLYSSVVSDVIGEWRAGRIEGLSNADLAELIESHLWLLPAEEKMSGEGYLIRQEIAQLRGGV